MVEELALWYEAHRVELQDRGIQTRFERSPNDGRPKASAWIIMQRGDVGGEAIVWDSGECELWGPVRETAILGTDPRAAYRELHGASDLSAALARVVSLFE
jgi:hypothetical protein